MRELALGALSALAVLLAACVSSISANCGRVDGEYVCAGDYEVNGL